MGTVEYIAIALGVLALVFLLNSLSAFRRKEITLVATNLALSLVFLFLGSVFALGAISVLGYHALTYEQLAATITVEPKGENQFQADFTFPNGEKKSFVLAGDQLLVDAHILKWKPISNILGLHTNYELARVTGRYLHIEDEQKKTHTVFALNDEDKLIDLFKLRRKFATLNVLLDAEYGSASFVPAKEKQQYILMISTSGLLFRRIID